MTIALADIANFCTVTGLAAVGYQIWCQRQDIRRAGRLSALTQMSEMLHRQIHNEEALISEFKRKGENWTGLAHKVNTVLRPAKVEIDAELVAGIADGISDHDIDVLKRALRIGGE